MTTDAQSIVKQNTLVTDTTGRWVIGVPTASVGNYRPTHWITSVAQKDFAPIS